MHKASGLIWALELKAARKRPCPPDQSPKVPRKPEGELCLKGVKQLGTPSSIDKRIRGHKGVAMRKRRMERSHWLCQDCLNSWPRVIQTADVVDHIVPLALGGEDVDDNTRNLCDPCHEKRTAEQFNRPLKKEFGLDGWPR